MAKTQKRQLVNFECSISNKVCQIIDLTNNKITSKSTIWLFGNQELLTLITILIIGWRYGQCYKTL
jgi:hypothetical protein